MRTSLFRTGLAAARPQTWHGQVILLQPLSLRLISGCVMLLATMTLVFLYKAHYTQRIAAPGFVLPDIGLIRVEPPSNGIVLERRVREGQQVRAGDVLYVVSSETAYAPEGGGTAPAGTAAAVLAQLRARQSSVEADARRSAEIEERTRRDARAKLASLQAELDQMNQEIVIQQERLASRTQVYERHAQAQAQGFLSPLALQQKYEELLEQRAHFQSLQRSRLSLSREVESARAEVATMDQRNALTRSEFTRQLAELEQERVTREADKRTLITAPQDGVVAAVMAEPGQRVDREPMLTIVPRHSRLEAQVMLPSSSIGSLRHGDEVKVRFAAFPYQRFGDVRARISEISATAVPAGATVNELTGTGAPANDGQFRVRIRLPSQEFVAAGRAYSLRPGMKVDVLFIQERRTLMEWLISPIAALAEKT